MKVSKLLKNKKGDFVMIDVVSIIIFIIIIVLLIFLFYLSAKQKTTNYQQKFGELSQDRETINLFRDSVNEDTSFGSYLGMYPKLMNSPDDKIKYYMDEKCSDWELRQTALLSPNKYFAIICFPKKTSNQIPFGLPYKIVYLPLLNGEIKAVQVALSSS
ncbi:MAG: hypothetical protein QXG00_00255 [Candidatus Woesearchaeota archaeon]